VLILDYRSAGWWYWLATVCLLTAGVSGQPTGFTLAIGLTLIQLVHFSIREHSLVAFPLQVRFAYLMLLLVALPASLQWVYWIPTIGTWAQVFFGYCAMARMVSLLPWNRKQAFSFALLKQTFISAPVRGNILHGLPSYADKSRHA
jgi:hypothetical protein